MTKSLLNRFISHLINNSDKKHVVEDSIVIGLRKLHAQTNQDASLLFDRAIQNLSPLMDCASFKRGAKIVRVPIPLDAYRSQSLALRWLTRELDKGAAAMPRVKLEDRFVKEVLAILEGKSPLLQKKAYMHREALINRSFAGMRWHVEAIQR